MMTLATTPPCPPQERPHDDPLMGCIDALLSKGVPFLKFPEPLEGQFLRDALEARRTHYLISGLLALLIYNGFLIADYLMVPDVFEMALRFRLYYLTPVGLVLLFLGTRVNWPIVKSAPPIVYEVIVVATGLYAAATLAFILSETHSPYAPLYHVGFSVVVMYGNIVQRVRFWYAVVFSLTLLAMHVTGVVLMDNFPPRLVWPIMSLVGATAIFSLTANYTMERDERRRYLLTLRERGLVRELSRTHERMQALSHVDGLTGLYNRSHFQEYLENVWTRAQFDKSQVSVMMVDVDQFKRYNERYGHQAGDECLQHVAKVLQATLRRPDDSIARYGGEEFIAVLPNTELNYALLVAERVRQTVEALQMRHESSTASLVLTVSIGVATCRADFNLTAPDLIAVADRALQQAKREGRNRIGAQVMSTASSSPGA